MFRRHFLIGVGATLVTAGLNDACGGSPSAPGPVTPPPPTTEPPPPPPPTPPGLSIGRILSFGDSMTAGTTSPGVSFSGLDAGLAQSYPFKLQTLLTARYSAQTVEVFNAGKAGEQAVTEGRFRLGGRLSEAKPQLLLLMEGANDLNNLAAGSTNVSPIVGALEDMVREASGRGVAVFVATIPQQRPGRPNTGQASLVPKYNNELKVMASKKDATLVDVNALLPLSMIGQDGLHPTEAGYQAIAEIFLEAIKARYEVAPSLG